MNGLEPADSVDDLVGETPLVALRRLGVRRDLEVFAKMEMFNPGGSAKDRPAREMLEDALANGLPARGSTIVESSSGNLGIALARACRLRDIPFHCVVDARTNPATIATMRAFAATVHTVDQPDPEIGDFLATRQALVRRLVEEIPGAITLDQYSNPANPRAHRRGTMAEIVEAMDGRVDLALVATSTTGTIAGCLAYLDDHGMDTKVVAVDAKGSVLFGGESASRHIPGFGAGVETPLSRLVSPDQVIRVDELACVLGCRWLAHREGILAGGSAGGVVNAYLQLERSLEPGTRTALVFHDGGGPYLNTVYNDEWVEEVLGVTPDKLTAQLSAPAQPEELTDDEVDEVRVTVER